MNRSYMKGQGLAHVFPALELIEFSRELVEGTISELGRVALETILSMSAVDVAACRTVAGRKARCVTTAASLGA